MKPKISVIAPVFNEKESLRPLMKELHDVLSGQNISYEILFIDDGSRDGSDKVLASPFRFHRRGDSGLPISDLLPAMAQHADDICVIRSMHCDSIDHTGATLQTFCGQVALPRPGIGNWLLYGLGTENRNLPSFVVLVPGGLPVRGADNWRSAFLPAAHQGVYVDT